jgi:hypothetical protein
VTKLRAEGGEMSDIENIKGRMRAAFATTPLTDDKWQAVLDILHANGYRRCAEGQGVTQWCAEVERVRANLKALEDEHIAYADDVGDALGQGEDEPLLTCARRVVAEVERLRGCRDELKEIGRAINDPRVHNTMTIAEWCRKASRLTAPVDNLFISDLRVFSDVLGHNYWMDAATFEHLRRRIIEHWQRNALDAAGGES